MKKCLTVLMMILLLSACGMDPNSTQDNGNARHMRVQVVVDSIDCVAYIGDLTLDFFHADYTYNTENHSIVIEREYYNEVCSTTETIIRDDNDELLSYSIATDNLFQNNIGTFMDTTITTTFMPMSENERDAVVEFDVNGNKSEIEYRLVYSELDNGNIERKDITKDEGFTAESRIIDSEGRVIDRKGYSYLESDNLAYYGRELVLEKDMVSNYNYYTEYKAGGEPFSLVTIELETPDVEGTVIERKAHFKTIDGLEFELMATITYTAIEAVESYELPDLLAEDIFFGFNKDSVMTLPLY